MMGSLFFVLVDIHGLEIVSLYVAINLYVTSTWQRVYR